MKKKILILGSTGSVGISTLKIIDNKKKDFKISLLSGNKNFNKISYQITKYKPEFFVINHYATYLKIKKKFRNKKIKILNSFSQGEFKKKIDISVAAIPGIAGLDPILKILKFSKKLLIANKESIICGWNLIKKIKNKYNVKIIPVDSEHYSIYKLLEHHKLEEIKKIYITASGGPFLNLTTKEIKKVKPKDALKHPKWKMGKKITIDSATMINKIFELNEAQKLFDIPINKIDFLIHPNSLIHAVAELKNGLTKFIYHETSMTIPLANAIYDSALEIDYFYKSKSRKIKKRFENLIFKDTSEVNFPIIRLKKRLNEHPSTPIIINASNEILVDQFLNKKIPFLSIFKIIFSILNNRNYRKYAIRNPKNINQIYTIDQWARETTINKIQN